MNIHLQITVPLTVFNSKNAGIWATNPATSFSKNIRAEQDGRVRLIASYIQRNHPWSFVVEHRIANSLSGTS